MKGIDLFAGGGGTTLGASNAGVEILWAANHNPIAVQTHQLNHPQVQHVCQDLHQADWSLVPRHDIVFASPCCQGHSKAAGKKKTTVKADNSRSTAWAVVSCLEAHQSEVALIENVPDFKNWVLFNSWVLAMESLGYSLSFNTLNAKNFGVPQNRERLFIIATRSNKPMDITWQLEDEIHAESIIDWDGHYVWDNVSSRVPATQQRVKNGRASFGHCFLDAAYGSEKGGRSLHKPLGTITTINKHSLVVGDKIRPLCIKELAKGQTFPTDYRWPKSRTQTKNMIGNAVPPVFATKITNQIIAQL